VRDTEKLKIRDSAELHITTPHVNRIFLVSVQDITDDGIFIDRPIIDLSLLPSNVGQDVMIVYTRNDATYRFHTRVLDELYMGHLPVLMIAHPEELERVQRRSHFRLNISLPIDYQQKKLLDLNKNAPYKSGNVLDLSAGGVKFSVPIAQINMLKKGDILHLKFYLTTIEKQIETEAVVLKKGTEKHNENRGNIVCRYLDITHKDMEAVTVHNIRYQQRYLIEQRQNSNF